MISIMCFLACLTSGAVYMVNQSAAAWMKNIASEVTVQIEIVEGMDVEKRKTEVAFFLARQAGIDSVPASLRYRIGRAVGAMARQRRGCGSRGAACSKIDRLAAGPQTHRPTSNGWPSSFRNAFRVQLSTTTVIGSSKFGQLPRSLALGGLAILVLVGAATTAIIVSANTQFARVQPGNRRGLALCWCDGSVHRARI